jgi:hypothetical protein
MSPSSVSVSLGGGGDGSDAQLSPVSEAASARLSETLREFDAL